MQTYRSFAGSEVLMYAAVDLHSLAQQLDWRLPELLHRVSSKTDVTSVWERSKLK